MKKNNRDQYFKTWNYKNAKFADTDLVVEPVEAVAEAPKAKKPRKAGGKKKAEVVAKKPAKEEATKAIGRKPGLSKKAEEKPKKAKAAKAKKTAGRKPGPEKKEGTGKFKKEIVVKAKKAQGRKPGRKAATMDPAVAERKRGPKGVGPAARKADLVKRGEEAFLFATRQQEQIEEMERVIANYERIFEGVRQLFSREMEELEELVAGLLE